MEINKLFNKIKDWEYADIWDFTGLETKEARIKRERKGSAFNREVIGFTANK